MEALREAGIGVKGLAAIFTYGFESAEHHFNESECAYVTLTDYQLLLEKALSSNYIEKNCDELRDIFSEFIHNLSVKHLKDEKWERERIAAEKRVEENRIADSKPTVKEEFYPYGQLKFRANYKSKNDGGEKHGLVEWYYDNGQLKEKGNYKDGLEDGVL